LDFEGISISFDQKAGKEIIEKIEKQLVSIRILKIIFKI